MAKRLALWFLALASPAIMLSFLAGGAVAEIAFALLGVAFPFALIVLGAEHKGRLGPLRWTLLGLVVFFELAVVAMLLLRGHTLDAPWVGGLPLATAIQVYGIFLLPLGVVSFAYALTFDRFGLRREDLEALRRRFPPQDD